MPADTRQTSSKVTSTLRSAFSDQDEVFGRAFSVINDGITQRSYPAAAVAVTQAGNLVALKSFGSFIYGEEHDEHSEPVSDNTLFDLASLTKPIATTTMAAILYERGQLDLDAPIIGTIPEFRENSDLRRNEVTFRMLLAHSSGLPAYEKLYLKADSRHDLLGSAFATILAASPGTRAEYSDIGFILLAVALERLAEDSFAAFCQRAIFGPLAMSNTTFNPPKEIRQRIPPTADERDGTSRFGSGAVGRSRSTFRNRIIQGEVQDENAWVLDGVAGHAGLFSTAEDIAKFAHTMLQGGSPILRQETIATFTRRESTPPGTTRTLGWDTPSNPSQSGKYFGPNSYGHLGYTGTSLWIDPDRQLSVTLLTNRTWPDCSNQAIKQVRPQFHDAIIEALNK